MKKAIFLLSLFSFSSTLIAKIPDIVQSKKGILKLRTDSKEVEKLGYGECNPLQNGEYLVIKNFIRSGNIVIDAGAHVGDWSASVLKQTNNDCTLYSFEPLPDIFNKLKDQVGSNAICYKYALGDIEAEMLMNYYYERGQDCSSLFDRKVLSSIPVKKITVHVTYLDKFCATNKIEHIHFLKIDTEGAEWDVLQGANKLITDGKIDIIQFEYGGTYPDANITLEQVYMYLISKNYAIFRITLDGLLHIPSWRDGLENYAYSNYLAVYQDTINY